MPKSAPFVPRTLPPLPPDRPTSRAQREREAKAYWDSVTEAQEVWELRKIGYFKIGQRSSRVSSGRSTRFAEDETRSSDVMSSQEGR